MKKDFTIDGVDLNIEDIFCATPKLQDYFLMLHERIERFDLLKWRAGVTQQALCKNMELTVNVFYGLDVIDLELLFYLKNTRGIRKSYFLKRIKQAFESENALYNDFATGDTEKIFNPFDISFMPLDD